MNDNFINDFQWAVIRLATFQTERGRLSKLLFATVTLLVPDRPPPPKMEKSEIQKTGEKWYQYLFSSFYITFKRSR